eukprot:12881189-Prorocentrum_lima.AAC.1
MGGWCQKCAPDVQHRGFPPGLCQCRSSGNVSFNGTTLDASGVQECMQRRKMIGGEPNEQRIA